MINYRYGLAIQAVLAASIALASTTTSANDLVQDDLLTASNLSTPWQSCTENSLAIDVSNLDAGGCAYRTTPVEAGVTYKMSCGINVVKYSSITLSFLDTDDNTLASKTTEVFEHVSGAYSVILQSPANTVTAAIGIYGEPGSGFQDCVLIDSTPPPEPTKGSISGLTWFDNNANSAININESYIAGTSVTLYVGDTVLAQTKTDKDGKYNFGDLDIGTCYTALFEAADATLALGAKAGRTDAMADGRTAQICLTEQTPDVINIDAAFVAVAPVIPPADYTACGMAWLDNNENGVYDQSDLKLADVEVKLVNASNRLVESTVTDKNGNYSFTGLVEKSYKVNFATPDGHETTSSVDQPSAGSSYVDASGKSPYFALPRDGNTPSNSACTIQHLNAGYIKLPVALEPTVARNDKAVFDVGVNFNVDILANDAACEANVLEVDLLGHNVPGNVRFNPQTNVLDIYATRESGTFTVKYGMRGACGSYDTAEVKVVLNEVIPPAPPAAPDAPICRVETRGDAFWGGVDVFNPTENGFSDNYNLYDRDRNLVITLDPSDTTHKKIIPGTVNHWSEEYIGTWEIEWNGATYGYDQVSIFYVAAVENNVESELTACARDSISPIAIDLENNGRIERLSGDYRIDLDGDGIEDSLSQWFGPSAGILVTGDVKGKITGESLFGNVPGLYEDGFAELATLDRNEDGQLTGAELDGLSIWNDLNSNAVVDGGELSGLDEHQIVALAVNHYKYMARAKKSDGSAVLMEDVWFPMGHMATLNQ